jgi:flagellar biosynthesis regulator FlaF
LGVPIDLFYELDPKLTPSRQEVDLLDISSRRYEALAIKLAGTEAALKKTQNIVSVQTFLLKEQDRVLKRMQAGLKRINGGKAHD